MFVGGSQGEPWWYFTKAMEAMALDDNNNDLTMS